MLGYFARRLAVMLLMIFLVSTMIFFLFRTMPGDPTAFVVDPSIPAEARQQLLERYGLHDSLWVQYQVFMKDLVKLDFGDSFFYNRPAMEIIGEKLAATLILMLTAMVFAYVIGIFGGAWMAWKRGTPLESVGITISLIFRSAPTFWVGLMVILLFSVRLGWFPAQGMRTAGTGGGTFSEVFLNTDFLKHLVLPALVAGLYFVATPLLIMRNSMLEVMSEDYIEMARAKGIKERIILYRHAARNALLPVVTAGALFIGSAIGGQVLIEVVFSWPGLGREIVTAVTRHDYPLAQGCFIIISAMVMFMNLVADMLYAVLDPRISYK
ncbi:ABC transporter permease [Anoxynatronum buryatiense]|uniref:Peptide/nickel transport system permease protein n=1 Tax=Anoxynatronum buryatiense TaxID=489973 RepID=A0AA45WTS1_9CLOT|nr:ABC transporter permease [Anoxynatronum buryatiense]SMP44429.1 peptide/nickel transport system permease protein [Anoxynatronum buryatiense]